MHKLSLSKVKMTTFQLSMVLANKKYTLILVSSVLQFLYMAIDSLRKINLDTYLKKLHKGSQKPPPKVYMFSNVKTALNEEEGQNCRVETLQYVWKCSVLNWAISSEGTS